MDKQYKVSFCTTCKGRLEHLKHALPINLKNNVNYPNVEFVILSYDSQDGLAEWIHENYQAEIDSGRIRFAQFAPAPYFKMAHAKNMAHRVATGDILCNLDADNITPPGFASWLNKEFSADPNIYVRRDIRIQQAKALSNKLKTKAEEFAIKASSTFFAPCKSIPEAVMKDPTLSGTAGRIAISRSDFYRLRGYDEKYEGWGGDDNNFEDRALRAGLRRIHIPYNQLGEVLRHSDEVRVENMAPKAQAKSRKLLEVYVVHRQQSFPHKVYRHVKRLVHEKPIIPITSIANPDGDFGCGRVRINFKDEVTLEPIEPQKTTYSLLFSHEGQQSGEAVHGR